MMKSPIKYKIHLINIPSYYKKKHPEIHLEKLKKKKKKKEKKRRGKKKKRKKPCAPPPPPPHSGHRIRNYFAFFAIMLKELGTLVFVLQYSQPVIQFIWSIVFTSHSHIDNQRATLNSQEWVSNYHSL